jgi:hypothetical protein
MKKLFVIISMLSSILVACGTNQPSISTGTTDDNKKEDQGSELTMKMEGYVIEKQSNQMLVVNPNPKEHTDAVWFSNIPNSIEIGDKVTVSFDIILESYPGQAEAKEVNVHESNKPQGADLTEAEALQKALAEIKVNTPILSGLQYMKDSDTWRIEVRNVEGENAIHDIKDN